MSDRQLALDGPGSSGKSSVGAAAASELGYRFCDTGLLYRAVTWLANMDSDRRRHGRTMALEEASASCIERSRSRTRRARWSV
jgi:cytidylate kinase